jgi:transposase-like protein
MRVREEVVPVRVSAVLLLKMGASRREVSRDLGVSRVTLIKWTRRFDEGGWVALLRDDTGTWTVHRKKRRARRQPIAAALKNPTTRRR